MEKIVYEALDNYFNRLFLTGYVNYQSVEKLLVLIFIYRLLDEDYRGNVTAKDYAMIQNSLYCLLGTDCLMPYQDYCKTGMLYKGSISELAYRVCLLENEEVVKDLHLDYNSESADIGPEHPLITIVDVEEIYIEEGEIVTDEILPELEEVIKDLHLNYNNESADIGPEYSLITNINIDEV